MRNLHTGNMALLTAALILLFAGSAMGAVIFDLSPTNYTTFRSADGGLGQGVDVNTTTAITDMAFYLNMPYGGDLKFMIWDGGNSNLLFSSVLSGVTPSDAKTWVSSNPFSFTLQAGAEYFFGIIADNNVDVGFIYPMVSYSANGLTADNTGNSNYSTFANPAYYDRGGAEIGLQLTGEPVSTPEPGSIFLLGGGLLGLAGVLRRKANLR
jgi:hypothetical protein